MFISLMALVLCFLLMFFMIRGVNRLYIDSTITKRRRQKIRRQIIKSKSFIDWLLLKEHRSVLPKSRIVWYFLNFLLFVISFITIVLFHLFGKAEIANSIPWTYFVINAVWCIAAKMNLLWRCVKQNTLLWLFWRSYEVFDGITKAPLCKG